MKLRQVVTVLCVASLGLAGCASKITQPDEYSGFLSDYSQLKQGKSPSGAEVMRWVDPTLDLSRYSAVYIEPTQFYPKPQATAKIPDSTLRGINDYFNQALKRELAKSLPLANGPGPGVIVVRAAITAVGSKTEGLKPYEFIPVAWWRRRSVPVPASVTSKPPWAPKRSFSTAPMARYSPKWYAKAPASRWPMIPK